MYAAEKAVTVTKGAKGANSHKNKSSKGANQSGPPKMEAPALADLEC